VEIEELVTMSPAKPTQASQTVAQQIAESLKRHGVEYIIGQSIPSSVTLAAVEVGIKQVLARTEKDGAIMADGYARATNRIPVVTSCSGPGTALLACGLGEALYASVPMVALVQDIPDAYTDRNAAQEFDDLAMLKTVTKHARRVTRPDRIVDYIDRAFMIAATGRPGPVALLLAPELFGEKAVVPEFPRTGSYGRFPLDRSLPAPEAIAAAADLIKAAARPVIIAGGGVYLSQARAEVQALSEAAGIPVGTTTMGRGAVPDEYPLALGAMTYAIGNRSMGKHQRPLMEEADLVILIGTRTNQNGTHSWKLYPKQAKFIHIDIDPNEIGRTYEAVRLVGDAKVTLQALTAAVRQRQSADAKARASSAAARIEKARAAYRSEIRSAVESSKTPVRPERVISALDKLAPAGTIMVGDASYATTWITNYVAARADRYRFITPRGQAGIGWGFPMALGVKLAEPDRMTVYLGGDGAFGYTWSELETAVRQGVKSFVAIVLNNSVFGYQKDAEDVALGEHTTRLHIAPVDHCAIAKACGWHAIRVERPDQVESALREALQGTQPVLVEVISDPSAYPPLITFDNRLPDLVE